MDGTDSSYIFISHRCTDHEVVYGIVDELEARGIRCWIDERDIPAGSDWYDEIRARRHDAAAVVWIKSPASAMSKEVLHELKLAQRHTQLIIPLEIARVADWEPEWDDFAFLQGFRSDNPSWGDRVAKQILALGGFAPAAVAGATVESRTSVMGVPEVARKALAHDRVVSAGEHEPLAIISDDGRIFQLDGRNGLGESLIENGDLFSTGDLGILTVSSDGAVIATSNASGEVELWTLGAEDAMRGPALAEVLPAGAGSPRLLSIDRPLGQAVRVIACGTSSAYSVMQQADGAWSAMKLIDCDESIVSASVVKDDVLFVRASGGTVWASNRSKRPLSLTTIRGIDAAVGADGRYYLAGWGSGPNGSSLVEVVVEVDGSWERIHRGPGSRAGIVRVVPDVVRQTSGALRTSIAVESGERSVDLLALP
jgi:TIR domain